MNLPANIVENKMLLAIELSREFVTGVRFAPGDSITVVPGTSADSIGERKRAENAGVRRTD